ncbi:MAG TPA: hypothetical protein VM869_01675, partial [Enhygromyxa sp.]|nr:hypothetical protein [Enhygromyxa sp.]
MRRNPITLSAMLLGTLACAPGLPSADEDDSTSGEQSEGADAPESECIDDSDCPEHWVCISQQWCEQTDTGPCDFCSAGEVCIEEACVAIEGLPSCAPVEVASTPTFMLAGEDGDLAIADVDGDGSNELVGVGYAGAITWFADGTAVESPLELDVGTSLQVASLRANEDAIIDLAVSIPSTHRLFQLAGDGAGGFGLHLERSFGSDAPWNPERLRLGGSVDGMVLEVSENVQTQRLYFDVITNNLPDQLLESILERWVVDLDGDDVDELIVANHDLTAIYRFDGELFVEVTQLPTSLELPSKDPWPDTASCDSFAAGDIDDDDLIDIVCLIAHYGESSDHAALVPFFHAGEFVFERGEPVVVASSGTQLRFFDLEGDGQSELLLGEAIVD